MAKQGFMARELRATHAGLAVTGTTCPGHAGSKLASLTIMTSGSSLTWYRGDAKWGEKWRDRYSLASQPSALSQRQSNRDRAPVTLPPGTDRPQLSCALILSYKRAVVSGDSGFLPFVGFPFLSYRVAA